MQLHWSWQKVLLAKHSQYNFKHFDFLQLHPIISFSGVIIFISFYKYKIVSVIFSLFFLFIGGGV